MQSYSGFDAKLCLQQTLRSRTFNMEGYFPNLSWYWRLYIWWSWVRTTLYRIWTLLSWSLFSSTLHSHTSPNQTLFNMLLCCEVEDSSLWDIVSSVLFHWTNHSIIIDQWESTLVRTPFFFQLTYFPHSNKLSVSFFTECTGRLMAIRPSRFVLSIRLQIHLE